MKLKKLVYKVHTNSSKAQSILIMLIYTVKEIADKLPE